MVRRATKQTSLPERSGAELVQAWFAARAWKPFPFQQCAWDHNLRGDSGLVHVPTGAGKTYAAYGGPLIEIIDELRDCGKVRGIRLLYVTPLRAVSRDIELALRAPIDDLRLGLTVESRTGDTSASLRARQRRELPNILVTTPESLTLMLTWPECREALASLKCVILDEWHELISSKRGTQTELAIARLRRFSPALRVWALSATLQNLDEAACHAAGADRTPVLVSAPIEREVRIRSVLPRDPDRFPWAGHMGLVMLPEVIEAIDPAHSTLIFTNTRSQAERWHHALHLAKPEWSSILALHHGSIDRKERERIEAGLKNGSLRIVVATSSLDLGVDFAPVERVMQIGSPKGIARLMQRAGRAGHRPGAPCEIVCIPTHGLEMIEVAAVRGAIAGGHIEPRLPLKKPLDVLVQHIVTCALGDGFTPDALFDEVRTAPSYASLTRAEFDWALSLVHEGGTTLRAYPDYHRVAPTVGNGPWRVPDNRIARLHRLNVGTITAEATVQIRFTRGRNLGSIEENFVSNLSAGDKFVFAGKVVEFVRLRDLVAYVRPARGNTNFTPIWGGTRLPISESLGEAMRETLGHAAVGDRTSPELAAASPIILAQLALSKLAGPDEFLIELCRTREGSHLFVYPFDGRLVHAGLAAILALRLTRTSPCTFSIASNDYGFELLADRGFDFRPFLTPDLFSTTALFDDAVASVNLGELARRQFREVARVAGLVFQTYPGAPKSARQLQSSVSLLYDVFRDFDPGNLLLEQARREVMEHQFEESRLGRTMARLRKARMLVAEVARPTPLGLPLVIERVGGRLSSETLRDRIEKIKEQWQKDLSKLDRAAATTRRRSPKSPSRASASS